MAAGVSWTPASGLLVAPDIDVEVIGRLGSSEEREVL
jgi:hypothetical protein